MIKSSLFIMPLIFSLMIPISYADNSANDFRRKMVEKQRLNAIQDRQLQITARQRQMERSLHRVERRVNSHVGR